VQVQAGQRPPVGSPAPQRNHLPWLLGGLAVLVAVGLVVAAVALLSADGDHPPEEVATTSGFVEESAQRGGFDPVPESGDATVADGTVASAPPDTVEALGEPSDQPVPATNLLMDGPGAALADLSSAIGPDTAVLEIVVYDTYVIAEYQKPAEPENVDRVIWRDGTVSEPEPVGFSDGDPGAAFMLDDIDPDRIPPLANRALDGFQVDGGVVTHVIVDRFFGMDDGQVAFRVYVSNPERGGGGYLLARLDGTVLDLVG
jgi:hypothetical protein